MAKALMSSYINCKVSSIWKIIPSKLFSISGSYFHIQIAVIVILFNSLSIFREYRRGLSGDQFITTRVFY